MALPIVFLGPSLPVEEAERFLCADYRPPIRRGDLVGLPSDATVGIIDGVFDQNLAVSPRELQTALSRGMKVYGSSSMGALRATEVPGVVGVGRVYEMFERGVIEDDDEVAITFEAESGRPLSEPMVNVRYAVERLVTPGTIPAEAGRAILEAAKALPYPQRTYPNILRRAGLGKRSDFRLLVSMLSAHDLKRDDAISLLERLPQAGRGEPRQLSQPNTRDDTTHRNQEDDRADEGAPVVAFCRDAPVRFWEFGAEVNFDELIEFLALTGALPGYARNAAARFLLQGNTLDLDLSDGPGVEQIAARVLDRLGAQWGFFTDEESRVTLADLGIGARAFEERVQEEIDAERAVMALVRGRSEEFLEALRMELFMNRLGLKRAAVRLASLQRLAACVDITAATASDHSEALLQLCALMDVQDRRDALRELSWWGVNEAALDSFVSLLARARCGARHIDEERRAAAMSRVSGLGVLKRSIKPGGELRFSAKASTATLKRLQQVVGITRVAMITGLSDIGIPNAQAFRPDGQFSSTVGSGKSTTRAGARTGAVMEELEKWAQEQYTSSDGRDVLASYEQLRRAERNVIDPSTLDLPYDTCYEPHVALLWRSCHDLVSGQDWLLPTSALTAERLPHDVYFSARAGRKQFGTNGLAAGFNLEDATCHALCEYIERHADVMNEICTGNPGAPSAVQPRCVDPASLPHSTRRLVRKIEASQRTVKLFDIRADIRVPTFRARIGTPQHADEHLFGVSHSVAFGKACHPNPEVAANMALLEATQSVMTVTAGAREDLTVRSRSLGRHERTASITREAFAVKSGGAETSPISFDSIEGLVSRDAKRDVEWVVRRVLGAGHRHVLLCDLSRSELAPARVVRVIIPGLETVNPFHTGLTARLALLEDLLPRFTPVFRADDARPR